MQAFAVNYVTGNLRPLSWNAVASKWTYLKKTRFPNVGPKFIIDIFLIGEQYADLHCAKIEIKGEPNKPVAQLTPLGWTYVGRINKPVLSTNFATGNNQDLVTIKSTITKLLELEGDSYFYGHEALSPADIETLWVVNKSLTYKMKNMRSGIH